MSYDALYRLAGCSELRGLRVTAPSEAAAERCVRAALALDGERVANLLIIPTIMTHGMMV